MVDGMFRDSNGRTLADYPRPSVAVDTALLTLDPDLELVVLQVRRPNGAGWALPGTFLHEGERLADAVDRSLRVKAGVRGLHPRQLHVFDDPNRDDRGWVLSVAHVDVVRADRLASASLRTPDSCRCAVPGDCPTATAGSSREPSMTSVRGTRVSPTPTGCSGTSSRCANCGSRTRPSRAKRCSVTGSAARWSRIWSRPARRPPGPEDGRRNSSGGAMSQSGCAGSRGSTSGHRVFTPRTSASTRRHFR